MIYTITIPAEIEQLVRAHLFQNELEQGAFLYASIRESTNEITLEVVDAYLVPAEGWQVQMDVHLEMKDEERAKIMKKAMQKNLALVDCHSHPGSFNNAWFSPSDRNGISEFAAYAQWKLGSKPYAAMVWAESSIDAVVWDDDFTKGLRVNRILVVNGESRILTPKGSWFSRRVPLWKVNTNG